MLLTRMLKDEDLRTLGQGYYMLTDRLSSTVQLKAQPELQGIPLDFTVSGAVNYKGRLARVIEGLCWRLPMRKRLDCLRMAILSINTFPAEIYIYLFLPSNIGSNYLVVCPLVDNILFCLEESQVPIDDDEVRLLKVRAKTARYKPHANVSSALGLLLEVIREENK
jgi:hypothetical protein